MTRRLMVPLLALGVLAGCESRDVGADLRVVDVHTGWYDMGIVDGQTKIVPSVALRFENVSDREIASVQMNAVFRRAGEDISWGTHFARAIGPEGLAPGATTEPIVLRSTLGYTGTQSRLELLENRQFVDAVVDIFGKHGSSNWVKMGEFTIDRQILTE